MMKPNANNDSTKSMNNAIVFSINLKIDMRWGELPAASDALVGEMVGETVGDAVGLVVGGLGLVVGALDLTATGDADGVSDGA